MRFEHLVEINDIDNPFMPRLDRRQVWAGLMHRVEDARPFLPGLDACHILARGHASVERRLHFGATQIHDRATYADNEWVRFETEAGASHGGGLLTIRIEEPEPLRLFLRFTYDTVFAHGSAAEDEAYADFLRQAYEAADIDTVQTIRLLAVEGKQQ